jgi:hypothetical protein
MMMRITTAENMCQPRYHLVWWIGVCRRIIENRQRLVANVQPRHEQGRAGMQY